MSRGNFDGWNPAPGEEIRYEWLDRPADAELDGGRAFSRLWVKTAKTPQTYTCRVTVNGSQMDFVFLLQAHPCLTVNGSASVTGSHAVQKTETDLSGMTYEYIEVSPGDVLTLTSNVALDPEGAEQYDPYTSFSVRCYWVLGSMTVGSGNTLQYVVKPEDILMPLTVLWQVVDENGMTRFSSSMQIRLYRKPASVPRTGDSFPLAALCALLLSAAGAVLIRRRSLMGR